MRLSLLLAASLILLVPALLWAQQVRPAGGMEKRVPFGPATAKEWSAAESSLEASAAPAREGRAALHRHVTVDFTTGEPGFPIGWPVAIDLTPRTKSFVNAMVAWPAADAGRMQREGIVPFEQRPSRLSPEECAKIIARQILAVQGAIGSKKGSRA